MILICPECGARTATPSSQDGETQSTACGNCGVELTPAEHSARARRAARGARAALKKKQQKVLLGLAGALALIFGAIMFPVGCQNSRVRRETSGPPRPMTLAQLVQDGPGGSRYIELTGFRVGDQYIGEEFAGVKSKAWVLLFPQAGGGKPGAIAHLAGGEEAYIEALMRQQRLRGVVSPRPEVQKAEIPRRLYKSYPGVKPDDAFYFIKEVKARPSEGGVQTTFVIGGVLLGVGALLIVLAVVRQCDGRRCPARPFHGR